jgi:hypothetical protein
VTEAVTDNPAVWTDICRAVLVEARNQGTSEIDPENTDGQLLFDAAKEAIELCVLAFKKQKLGDKGRAVLMAAQRACEQHDLSLEGFEVEIETARGQKKMVTFTRDDLFELESSITPVTQPEVEQEAELAPATNGSHEDQKTIEDVISGYAQLTATQIADKMKALPDEDIEFVKEHEGAGEDRPQIMNFGSEQWQGEEEESKEYEQEQEAPETEPSYFDKVVKEKRQDPEFNKHYLRERVDQLFLNHFGEADYDKRRRNSIERKLGEFTPDEIQTLLEYEGLPKEHDGPRHRQDVIQILKDELKKIAKIQPELVEEEQVAEVPAPEPEPEEPKFNPATQQMESAADLVEEGRQERQSRLDEVIKKIAEAVRDGSLDERRTVDEENYQERKERLRQERLEGRQQEDVANETLLDKPMHDAINPRQQGAIEQEDLNQRVLRKLGDLGLPEPEIPSEVPTFPGDLDNGITTDPLLDKQIALFGVNEGYATYHASHYEAEAVAKKAMADKAAHELRKTIGLTDADGKHRKLEAQIDAEVETHPTVAVYREEQRLAESMAKRLHGNAAFYASCKWALHGVRDRRRESQKGPQ